MNGRATWIAALCLAALGAGALGVWHHKAHKPRREAQGRQASADALAALRVRLTRLPDANERRQADIQAALAGVSEPRNNPQNDARVKSILESVLADRGVNATPYIFAEHDLCVAIADRDCDDRTAYVRGITTVDALADFDAELRRRGIELIVLPVPTSLQLFARELAPGLGADHVVWSQYARCLRRLLEAGVDAIDLREPMRRMEDAGTHPLLRFDHHMSSEGLLLAADAVRDRLTRRFAFEMLGGDRRVLSLRRREVPTLVQLIADNGIVPGMPREPAEAWAGDMVPKWVPPYQTALALRVLDVQAPLCRNTDSPVLVIGDSCGSYQDNLAASFSHMLSHELGFIVADESRAGLVYDAPRAFVAEIAPKYPQLRAAVFIMRATWLGAQGQTWTLASKSARQRPVSAPAWPVEVLARALSVSTAPVPSAAYPQALIAIEFQTTPGGPDAGPDASFDGPAMVAYQWGMRQAKLEPPAAIRPGEVWRLKVQPWSQALRTDPRLLSVARSEDKVNLDIEPVWVLEARRVK